MIEIIGVRFRNGGKVYYFSPNGFQVSVGDYVVTETARGVEQGEVIIANKKIDESEITAPLKNIIRLVNSEDKVIITNNKKKEERAFQICEQKIAYRKLDMKLINVECAFDNSKIMFYFTSENRVDFRELVKDLASIFKTRIELRQVGVRDHARLLGGVGICGREYCCKGYLQDFQPVSIKMAKEQGLSLNPSKISGGCGRLMCCLKNEENVYEEFLKVTPKLGAIITMKDGKKARVIEANTLTGALKAIPEGSDIPVKTHRDEVTILKDGRIKVNHEEMKALKGLE